MTRVVAVHAGLGEPSSTGLLTTRLVEAVGAELAAKNGGDQRAAEVEVIALRDLALDIARSLTSGFPSGAVREAIAAVEEADALIVATPVFNASYSGLFKSFFDLVDLDRMVGKPVVIAATGGSPRHSMVLDHALRPLFAYLRTIVMPTGVYAAAEDFAGGVDGVAPLTDRVARAARELVAVVDGPARDEHDAAHVAGSPAGGSTSTNVEANAGELAGIANFARLLHNYQG